jgi:hypothetical protein
VQFVRSRAVEWGLDKRRLGIWGASAGAFSGLWLATHPDLAVAGAADRVARESTRPYCVADINAQTTLDPRQMRSWVGPGVDYGAHAFAIAAPGDGRAGFERFLRAREGLLPWIGEYSPAELVAPGTPAILLDYGWISLTPTRPESDYYTHSPRFGMGFCEISRRAGNECHLLYQGRVDARYGSWQAFLIAKLSK